MFIAITGPESSGKTSLARFLSKEMGSPLVQEFSRYYLEDIGRPYAFEDLSVIAEGQERNVIACNDRLIISDTFMFELIVWGNRRFGRVPGIVSTILDRTPPDAYILCKPDIPWEPDPLRENPMDRDVLYDDYLHLVTGATVPWLEIKGEGMARRRPALDFVLGLIEKGIP